MSKIPDVVAEVGPGDSLGIGFSALLSGSKKYIGLDIIRHANIERNLHVLDDLSNMFNREVEIPNGINFDNVNPKIDSNELPLIVRQKLPGSFRVTSGEIKNALLNSAKDRFEISYYVPWYDDTISKNNSCDLIISQAVMEHLPEIDIAYKMMYKLLKTDGYMSHQIDFKAHETAELWYGHYTYSKQVWKVIMHGRKYLINREPVSAHIKAIENTGFKILKIVPVYSEKLPIEMVARNIKSKFSEKDLSISSALIIARKF
jgi:SAM-dependent methyltransferase